MKKTKYLHCEIICRVSSVTTISFLKGNQSPKFTAPSSSTDITDPPVSHETSEQFYLSKMMGPRR